MADVKVKIDKTGNLYLNRRGFLKCCDCPVAGACYSCGDWCPLFDVEEDAFIKITLCKREIVVDWEEFIDERDQDSDD